jgi:hypothetical protein
MKPSAPVSNTFMIVRAYRCATLPALAGAPKRG